MSRRFRHGNRRRLGFSISAVTAALICLVIIAHGQQQWTPTRKGSYGRMTRDALDRLLESANDLRTGHPAEAKKVLEGMEGPVAELTGAASFFREQANRESDRCTNNIGILETRVAEIYQQELQVKGRIDDLDAQLAAITEKKTLTETEIARLRTSVQITEEKLRERERKLEELRRWWWVPFYGLYLGVRTLVDDDVGNYNSLKNTLDDASIKMAHHQQEYQAAQAMKEALSKELETMRKTHAGLQEMRAGAEAELGNLKKSAVFLTDAGIFWKRVSRLLKIDVSQSLELAKEIQVLESEMTSENTAPRFDSRPFLSAEGGRRDLQQRPIMELYESLAAFADTIDQGKNFLEAAGTDFCGGPARSASGPDVASACNIERFTPYYEITDPKTCAFRPLNPPGCPPRPQPVIFTTQDVYVRGERQVQFQRRRRGIWIRAADQNWIDGARCDSSRAIYYGKANNQDECERKCKADSACVNWTFNRNDGHMGNDSIGECWGGTPALAPLKQSSPGFESGGADPASKEVDCSIFDDGYTNLQGPAASLSFYRSSFEGEGQACITPNQQSRDRNVRTCRKWFGRCTTPSGIPVNFSVFDDGYTNLLGPTDAIFINKKGQACVAFQGQTACRKWFGRGVAADGRKSVCMAFWEGGAPTVEGQTNLTDALRAQPKLGGAFYQADRYPVPGPFSMLAECPPSAASSSLWGGCAEPRGYWGLCEVQ